MEPESQATLNGIFQDVVQHLLDNAPHADFFSRPCALVADYSKYVPADQEMFLSRILERAQSHYYSSLSEFRRDLQLIHSNAAAYHGPSGGFMRYEPVIHWAHDLLLLADGQIHRRLPLIQAAEAKQVCSVVQPKGRG